MKMLYLYIALSIILFLVSSQTKKLKNLSGRLAVIPLLVFTLLNQTYELSIMLLMVQMIGLKSKSIKDDFLTITSSYFFLCFMNEKSFIVGIFILLFYSIFYRQLINNNGPNIIFLVFLNIILFLNLNFLDETNYINPFNSISDLTTIGSGIFLMILCCYIGVFNKHLNFSSIDQKNYGLIIPTVVYMKYEIILKGLIAENINLILLISFTVCVLNLLCLMKENFINKSGYEVIFYNYIIFLGGISLQVPSEIILIIFFVNTYLKKYTNYKSFFFLSVLTFYISNTDQFNNQALVCLVFMLLYKFLLLPLNFKREIKHASV